MFNTINTTNTKIQYSEYEIGLNKLFLKFQWFGEEKPNLQEFVTKLGKYYYLERITGNIFYITFDIDSWFSDNFKSPLKTNVKTSIKVTYYFKIPLPFPLKEKIPRTLLENYVVKYLPIWMEKFGKRELVVSKFKMMKLLDFRKIPFHMFDYTYNCEVNAIEIGFSTIFSLYLYKKILF